MAFPETIDELRTAGYEFQDQATCRGCGAAIAWWQTPRGRKMPLDVDAEGNCEPHWSSCPEAKRFRK